MLGYAFPTPVTSWNYLLQLTAEAQYDALVRSGFWVWIFDNVNLQEKVRHEREGKSLSTRV